MQTARRLRLYRALQLGLALAISTLIHGNALAASTHEKPQASPTRILVLDVTGTAKGSTNSQNRAFFFEPTETSCDFALLHQGLHGLATTPTSDGGREDSLLNWIRGAGGQTSRRWISDRGDLIRIFVFKEVRYPLDLQVEEKARETQLGSDVAKLFTALAAGPNALMADSQVTQIVESSRTLERRRATLTVRAAPATAEEMLSALLAFPRVAGFAAGNYLHEYDHWKNLAASAKELRITANKHARPDDVIKAMKAEADAKADSQALALGAKMGTAEVTLTTGPTEHWYLSTLVPLQTVKDVKYVDSTGTLDAVEKPTRFLIGANFLLGDVLSETRRFPRGLALGAFVEASARPLRYTGFSLSYRIPAFTRLGLEFNLISPFWALVRTTKDVKPASGAVERDKKSVYKGVWGLSLNLDKAVGWL